MRSAGRFTSAPGLLHGCDLLHTAVHRLWVTSPGGYAACTIVVHSPAGGAVVRGAAAAGQCGCVKAGTCAPGAAVAAPGPGGHRHCCTRRRRRTSMVGAQVVSTRYRPQRPGGCYPGAGLIAHVEGRRSCPAPSRARSAPWRSPVTPGAHPAHSRPAGPRAGGPAPGGPVCSRKAPPASMSPAGTVEIEDTAVLRYCISWVPARAPARASPRA
jgi:hypothetical protein